MMTLAHFDRTSFHAAPALTLAALRGIIELLALWRARDVPAHALNPSPPAPAVLHGPVRGDVAAPRDTAQRRHCYHCGIPHDVAEMRRGATATGMRWRCLKSIDAARQPRQVREDAGIKRSAENRAESRRRAEYMNLFRRRVG